MSAYTGDIVKDGLVLCLDAGNIKSYSGTGTAWNDMSGQRNNAVLTNGPTYTALNKGAIILDGSNDCAVVNGNAAILSKTAYTKMAWFYVTSFSTANNIISGGNGAEHAFWMASTNKLNAGHNGSWSTIVGNTTLSLNTWYFGAVTYNSTTGWVLYLNGVQDATNGTTTTFNGTQEVLIGGYGTGANPFTGRISYALVYNRVLSAAEIRENYNATKGRYDTTRSSDAIKPRLSTSGLVLHLDAANYRSYTGSGTSWRDLSGDGNNGTLTNGPTYSSTNNGSIVFDGTNDVVNINNPASFRNQNFTVALWLNPLAQNAAIISIADFDHASAPAQGWVLQSEDATTNRYYYLGWHDGSQFQPVGGFGAGLGIQVTTSAWQHLVYTKSGTSLLGYLNGTLVYNRTGTSATVNYQSNRNFQIANCIGASTRAFKGNISQLNIYNRALSAAEVRENYNLLKIRYGYVL